MSHDHEDLAPVRRYLNMDERELANVQAEHDKYARRKAAMAYGAASAGVEPITFAPSYCTGCDILLTRQNHGDSKRCNDCFLESCALRFAENKRQERQHKKLAEAKASGIIVMGYVLFLCICAGLAAWGLAKGIDAAVWWLSNR